MNPLHNQFLRLALLIRYIEENKRTSVEVCIVFLCQEIKPFNLFHAGELRHWLSYFWKQINVSYVQIYYMFVRILHIYSDICRCPKLQVPNKLHFTIQSRQYHNGRIIRRFTHCLSGQNQNVVICLYQIQLQLDDEVSLHNTYVTHSALN